MVTKTGTATIIFCCETMMNKVLENHIQMILTGVNFFRVFSGSMGGWEAHGEKCPSMKFCPYCQKQINRPREKMLNGKED